MKISPKYLQTSTDKGNHRIIEFLELEGIHRIESNSLLLPAVPNMNSYNQEDHSEVPFPLGRVSAVGSLFQ